MKLTSIDGSTFELTIVGYEFPDNLPTDNNDYDANWLILIAEAFHPQRWQTSGPFMTTWEAKKLRDWLVEVASGKTDEAKLRFTESEIRFTVLENLDDVTTLQITYKYVDVQRRDVEQINSTFRITRENLEQAVKAWTLEIASFPIRKFE